ncbi:hypothetical protein KVMX100_60006 [Klebsiella variicola]|nr:hypothetical protein KVMX100_60006 [Klebsiella variicola]
MSLGSTSRQPLTALTAGPAPAQDMPPEIGQALAAVAGVDPLACRLQRP